MDTPPASAAGQQNNVKALAGLPHANSVALWVIGQEPKDTETKKTPGAFFNAACDGPECCRHGRRANKKAPSYGQGFSSA
jgi:hypothetical protein